MKIFEGSQDLILMRKGDLFNLSSPKANMICAEWYKVIRPFYNGRAAVQTVGGQWNFINLEGKLISDWDFLAVNDFHENFASVKLLPGRWTFIDLEGRMITDTWFRKAGNFDQGFAKVGRFLHQRNLLRTNGELFSPKKWYPEIEYLGHGIVVAFRFDASNFPFYRLFDLDAKLLLDWTLYSYGNMDLIEATGMFSVWRDNGYFLLDSRGQAVSDQVFDLIEDFIDEWAVVRLDDHYNLINRDGKFASEFWFDEVPLTKNEGIQGKINGKKVILPR